MWWIATQVVSPQGRLYSEKRLAVSLLIFAIWLLLLFLVPGANAEPPPGTDLNSPTAKWFHSLKMPGSGTSCCDTSDCRYTDERIVGDHHEAWMDPKKFTHTYDDDKPHWVSIPQDRILAPDPTAPTDQPVLCYGWGHVYCFHSGPGT